MSRTSDDPRYSGCRPPLIQIGCVFIFAVIVFGIWLAFIRPIMNGQPPIQKAQPCSVQYELWRQETSFQRQQLARALGKGDQAGVRNAASMLWPVVPPQCKTNPYKWERLMKRLAHDEPLSPSMAQYMHRLTTINYQGENDGV